MLISFGGIEEIQSLCQIYKYILHNEAARITLDLDYRSSASAALVKLSWKNLKDRRSSNHFSIFIYKCRNNLFSHNFEITYSQGIHLYITPDLSPTLKSL